MEAEIVATPNGLAVVIPADVAERYHMAEGVKVELEPEGEGIFFKPVGVESWFSVEWERALDGVVDRYGSALGMISE